MSVSENVFQQKTKTMDLIKICTIIWQFPQILLGKLLVLCYKPKFLHKVSNVKIYQSSKIEGLSLGAYIFVDINIPEGTAIIKHEFGHVVQSRILGVLYIPVIVIPSYLWYLTTDKFKSLEKHYYSFYTESWANKYIKSYSCVKRLKDSLKQ